MQATTVPTIGRTVHYDDGTDPCIAAIITHAEGDAVGLHVMPYRADAHTIPTLTPADQRPAGERQRGTWHWPERS